MIIGKKILLEAAKLVEKGWTQKVYARDRKGRSVDPGDETACKFCMLGAIDRSARDLGLPGAPEYVYDAVRGVVREREVKPGSADTLHSRWNDYKTTTAADVAKVLRRAARRA